MEKQLEQGLSLADAKRKQVAIDRKKEATKTGKRKSGIAAGCRDDEDVMSALIEEAEAMHDESMLIGRATLRRMFSAVYDENDPLYGRNTYSECGGRYSDFQDDPSIGSELVYVYYHSKGNNTIMTNVKGDLCGAVGSSAGFKGKLHSSDLAERPLDK